MIYDTDTFVGIGERRIFMLPLSFVDCISLARNAGKAVVEVNQVYGKFMANHEWLK